MGLNVEWLSRVRVSRSEPYLTCNLTTETEASGRGMVKLLLALIETRFREIAFGVEKLLDEAGVGAETVTISARGDSLTP